MSVLSVSETATRNWLPGAAESFGAAAELAEEGVAEEGVAVAGGAELSDCGAGRPRRRMGRLESSGTGSCAAGVGVAVGLGDAAGLGEGPGLGEAAGGGVWGLVEVELSLRCSLGRSSAGVAAGVAAGLGALGGCHLPRADHAPSLSFVARPMIVTYPATSPDFCAW